MGVPVVDAPSEAEAQCAAMAKAGVVYAAATEDMDCLTFGAPRLIRNLMASQVRACAGVWVRRPRVAGRLGWAAIHEWLPHGQRVCGVTHAHTTLPR
jgi:hypothetical protein